LHTLFRPDFKGLVKYVPNVSRV